MISHRVYEGSSLGRHMYKDTFFRLVLACKQISLYHYCSYFYKLSQYPQDLVKYLIEQSYFSKLLVSDCCALITLY